MNTRLGLRGDPDGCSKDLRPDVWITANPIPFVSRELILK